MRTIKFKKMYLVCLIPVALMINACLQMDTNEEKSLTFETISMGDWGSDIQDFLVIGSAKEWDIFRKEYLPRIKASDIDFQNHFVIVAFLGEKATGGYGIQIENVTQIKDMIRVTVNITEPAPGQYVTEGSTNPYHIVRVKKGDMTKGNLTFVFVDVHGEELARKSYYIN
jgi:hypothetical protein